MKAKLRTYFITGLIVLLPLILTIYMLTLLYRLIADFFSIFPVFSLPYNLGILLNIAILVVLILFIGYLTATFFLTRYYSYLEKLFTKIPLIGKLYRTTKQITDALFITNKNAFRKAVLVEYPRKGIYSIGFVTKEKEVLNNKDYVNVFIPTVPFPMSGFLIHVKKSEIIPSGITVEEAIKLIFSGGAIVKTNP